MPRIDISSQKIPAMRTYYDFGMLTRGLKESLVGSLKKGEHTKEFEAKMADYCGTKYSAAFPLARVAFYYALKALNLPKGSEIILPPYTMADFINVIRSFDLEPVFVDISFQAYNADIEGIKKAITPKSKVLLLTHLFGITPEMEPYVEICQQHGLFLLEDFSQNLGCTYKAKKIGSFGHLGIVSLSSLKTCGTFFGGMAVSDNKPLIDEMARQHALDKQRPFRSLYLKLIIKSSVYEILTTRWIYSYLTFYLLNFINRVSPTLHYKLLSGNMGVLLGEGRIPERRGLSPKMFTQYTDFQAKEGLRLLQELDHVDSARIRLVELLYKNVSNEVRRRLVTPRPDIRNVYWRFPLRTDNRVELKNYLLKSYIETSVNLLPNCSQLVNREGQPELVNAKDMDKNVLFLPIHHKMSEKQVLGLANALNRFYESKSRSLSRYSQIRPKPTFQDKLKRKVKDYAGMLEMGYALSFKDMHPWFVTFRITYRCNFHCSYCDSPNMNVPEMTTQQIKDMIDELKKLGMRKMAISGGEPLVRKDLPEILSYCKSQGIFTNIGTNGYFYKDMADQLKDLDMVVFSLDGPKEINDAIRKAGSYDRVLEAIEIAKYQGKQVNVISVVTAGSIPHIDEMLALSRRYQFGVIFQPVTDFTMARESSRIQNLQATKQEFDRAIDYIMARQKAGDNILFSRDHYQYLKDAFFVEDRRECKHKGRYFISINPDGRVAACTPKEIHGHWINGNEVGWRKAIEHVRSFNCEGCFSSWLEIDDLSDRNPRIISYWLRNKSDVM